MNPLSALLGMPTCEEVLGPHHYSLFSRLQGKFQETLKKDKQKLSPVIESIANRLTSELGIALEIVHSYPVFHETGDTGGYGPHVFAIKTSKNNHGLQDFSGRLVRRRTVALVSVGDSTKGANRWVKIAVASHLRKSLQNMILKTIESCLKECLDIPEDQYRTQVGFGHNFALLNWTPRRARELR